MGRALGAGHRPLSHCPLDSRGVSFVWSADLAGQGWGINPDFGGYPDLRGHGARSIRTSSCAAATRSTPTGRCRRDVTLPDGRVVAQPRDAGEVEGRRDAGRVPRQLRLQPARRQCAPFAARGAAGHPVGRPRGRATTGTRARSSTTRATPRRRADVLAARPGRPSRVRADRTRRRDRARRIYRSSRTGRCWTCSCSTCAPTGPQQRQPPRRPDARRSSAREQLAWLKRELAPRARRGR